MKLKECMELGKDCGLQSIDECYLNIEIHALSLFQYEYINKELSELQKDIFYHKPDIFCKMFKVTKEEVISKGWETKTE